MSRIFLLIIIILLSVSTSLSQTPTQVIRGKVIDVETRIGLPGANIVLMLSDPLKGATSNPTGNFIIDNVPVGRHSLMVSFVGYKPAILPEILVTSGKECIVNIELQALAVTTAEVEIKATVNKDKPTNPMAMVSARSFNVEESRRYAGALDDPMRMVANFAGVVSDAGVNSNEIVIRGNSPKGLLWANRVEVLPSSAARCSIIRTFTRLLSLPSSVMHSPVYSICASGTGTTSVMNMPSSLGCRDWMFRQKALSVKNKILPICLITGIQSFTSYSILIPG
jgi:hypothetical protein